MSDIFDQVAPATSQTGDIFDQVSPPAQEQPPAQELFSDKPKPSAAVLPPQDHKEELVKSIAGDFGLSTYRQARDIVNRVEGVVKSPAAAYGAAREAVKGIGENIKNNVLPEPYDLEVAHHTFRDQPIPPGGIPSGPGVGKLAGDFAESEAAAPVGEQAAAASEPSLVQRVVKGEKIAQAPAKKALESGAKSATAEGGASTVQPESLRESLSAPIDSVEGAAKQNYQLMDKATGGEIQPNLDKLQNVNNKLRAIAGTDDAKEAELLANKTRLEWQQEQLFDKAQANGVPKETVDMARTQFKQAQAMRDVETKVFKNPSVVAGNATHGTEETVDVDKAIRALQKLQDNTEFGAPRLEQALGKSGAKQILDDMYAAQRLGVKALSQQQIAKWVGGIVGAAGLISGTGKAISAIAGH